VIFRADIGRILAFDLGTGEIVFLVGCAFHAFYTPLVRRLNRGEPVLVFTFCTIVAGAALLGLTGAPAMLATDWAALPGIVWITIAYLAVLATVLSFLFVQYATLRLPSSYPDLFMKLASFRVFALDRPALPGVDDAGTWSSPGGLVFGACRRRWPRVSRALGMYPAEHERDHRGVRAS